MTQSRQIEESDDVLEQQSAVTDPVLEKSGQRSPWISAHDVPSAREMFLDEAHALLGSSLDPEAILEQLGWIAVPAIADWCVTHILDPQGRIQAISLFHQDPSRIEHLRLLAERHRPRNHPDDSVYRVLHGGPAELYQTVSDEDLRRYTDDEEHLRHLRTLGCCSVMLVPLVGRTGVLASLTFVRAESELQYTQEDLRLAEDLARRGALAVENARLFDAERKARAQAERVIEQTRRLQAVTSKLSRALPAEHVARIVLHEGSTALGADMASIWLVDDSGGHLQLLGSRDASRGVETHGNTLPLDASTPLAEAVRTGTPIYIESRTEYARRYARPDDDMRDADASSDMAVACIPLTAEDRTLGGLTFTFIHAQKLDAEDRTFMAVLADHCAQALDRMRLLEQERRSAAKMGEINRTLDAIIRASPAAITLLDLDGTVRMWNPAAERIFGWHADEVLGRPLPVISEDKRGEARRILERIARGEPIVGMETQRLTRNRGIIDVAVWAAPAFRPDGTRQCLSLLVDITDRKQAEDAARVADQRKDEFLAMLGHELRNPLAPIITALQLMKMRGDTGAERERTIIERQARHLIRLVDDLLDISRITRGKIELRQERVELRPILNKAIEMASPLLDQRSHTLDVQVPHEGLALLGDQDRLAQVFQNLLTNAAKYTGPGGNITVRAWREADEILVSVKDNGTGIAAHQLETIFEPFAQGSRTLDRSEGGLGIGLPLVRSLLALHDGNVVAQSGGPGTGSEFVVRLPALSAQAEQGDNQRRRTLTLPPLAMPAPSNGVRVLVVDDNTDAADTLGEILKNLGYDVLVRHDGPTAIETAQELMPDIALLDIGLPVMDGYELATRLRGLRQEMGPSMVAITGYGQEHDRQQCLEAGFHEHFVKPIDTHRLARVLENLSLARSSRSSAK